MRDISNAKQEIINFRKIIRPQRTVLRDLERNKQRYLAEDLDIYFDDIVDASERIWDMLENYKEVVEALEETNESVISHRVNGILRVLTSFSVIILPLTLIASIWGMNVGVPGEGERDGVLGHRRRRWSRCSPGCSPSSAAAAGSDGVRRHRHARPARTAERAARVARGPGGRGRGRRGRGHRRARARPPCATSAGAARRATSSASSTTT